MSKLSKQTFLKRIKTSGQQVYEKVPDIAKINQTSMIHHCLSAMTITKKTKKTHEDAQKVEPSDTASGNIN
jgi:hypothetical protein